MRRMLVCGEGRNELGRFHHHAAYRGEEVGVLEALLQRISSESGTEVQVIEGLRWRDIRKFQAGGHATAEERNVRGLVLQATERGIDCVAFVRDRDGDLERERRIERGLSTVGQDFPKTPVIGGVAVEKLEAWILGLLGQARSEELANPSLPAPTDTTEGMVAVVQAAELSKIPEDAASLRAWVERAQQALRAVLLT